MAKIINYLGFLSIFTVCYAIGIFDKVLPDVSPCNEVCLKTFAPHTYEKSNQQQACDRGCRLYSIMEFGYDDPEEEKKNMSLNNCIASCTEAYTKKEGLDACTTGCKSQLPFSLKRIEEEKLMEPSIRLVHPLMYMHSLCSNMMDTISSRISVSWSAYMKNENGNVVIVKSQPHIYVEFADEPDLDDYKTVNYLETNIEPLDNSATPMLKSSQIRSARSEGGFGSAYSVQDTDWLSCIAKKTGAPRLFLMLLILCCSLFMIWLCLNAANTAPDQKVAQQKLSINGDLEYLKQLEKSGLLLVSPQEKIKLNPLPIKIKVQKI